MVRAKRTSCPQCYEVYKHKKDIDLIDTKGMCIHCLWELCCTLPPLQAWDSFYIQAKGYGLNKKWKYEIRPSLDHF